jgi:hypothetical protein
VTLVLGYCHCTATSWSLRDVIDLGYCKRCGRDIDRRTRETVIGFVREREEEAKTLVYSLGAP